MRTATCLACAVLALGLTSGFAFAQAPSQQPTPSSGSGAPESAPGGKNDAKAEPKDEIKRFKIPPADKPKDSKQK
jgi:hypothetical protein